jgi:DNA ligase D-like protein (predicted 3'-phosphoesterase)
MPLTLYQQKRNFKKTSEPKPIIKKSSSKNKKLIYTIHEHHASHLHWDLRLEINGVLKSWAIPKSPPTEKNIKRLAIQVEDHPISYANFEGTIPEGNYGAGKVIIWDKGTYELKEKSNNKIEIILNGKKLKGNYVLIKTDYTKNKNSWLFFKTP